MAVRIAGPEDRLVLPQETRDRIQERAVSRPQPEHTPLVRHLDQRIVERKHLQPIEESLAAIVKVRHRIDIRDVGAFHVGLSGSAQVRQVLDRRLHILGEIAFRVP
jgi:hypothetical protein